MDGGYQGKILRVNLTDQTAHEEPLREDWAREFIGGRGYGTRILMEEVDPKVDPLAPENKVVIATGPLDGTTAPSSGRVMVITKGALNGAIASSNAGGYFGPMLKRAGYDLPSMTTMSYPRARRRHPSICGSTKEGSSSAMPAICGASSCPSLTSSCAKRRICRRRRW